MEKKGSLRDDDDGALILMARGERGEGWRQEGNRRVSRPIIAGLCGAHVFLKAISRMTFVRLRRRMYVAPAATSHRVEERRSTKWNIIQN